MSDLRLTWREAEPGRWEAKNGGFTLDVWEVSNLPGRFQWDGHADRFDEPGLEAHCDGGHPQEERESAMALAEAALARRLSRRS